MHSPDRTEELIRQLRELNRKLGERIRQLERERIPPTAFLERKVEFNQRDVAALWQSSLLGLGVGSVAIAVMLGVTILFASLGRSTYGPLNPQRQFWPAAPKSRDTSSVLPSNPNRFAWGHGTPESARSVNDSGLTL